MESLGIDDRRFPASLCDTKGEHGPVGLTQRRVLFLHWPSSDQTRRTL